MTSTFGRGRRIGPAQLSPNSRLWVSERIRKRVELVNCVGEDIMMVRKGMIDICGRFKSNESGYCQRYWVECLRRWDFSV